MRYCLLAFSSALLMACPGAYAAEEIVTDPVEHYNGWRSQGFGRGGEFVDGSELGIGPVEGKALWFAQANDDGLPTAGVAKIFDQHFKAGSYEVRYSIGHASGHPYPKFVAAFLFADTNGDGEYDWDERILPAGKSRQVPHEGWEQWTDTYKVDADSTNARGDSILDAPIGFFLAANLKDVPDSCLLFDGVTINYTP